MTIKNLEFKQQRMLRIEHKITGKGLYHELRVGDPKNKHYDAMCICLSRNREQWNKNCEIATWKDLRPGPLADPYLRSYWTGVNYFTACFGFSDVAQMKNWFSDIPDIKELLVRTDFHIVHLKSKHIIHGYRQAFATRSDSIETLGSYSIDEIL